MEKKLRVKLEEELKELRAAAQAHKDGNTEPRNYPSGADSLDELRRKFGEAEEKVNFEPFYRGDWNNERVRNPNGSPLFSFPMACGFPIVFCFGQKGHHFAILSKPIGNLNNNMSAILFGLMSRSRKATENFNTVGI